ncbi:hypothetical protein Bca52824_014577 [Brassica carinata]|uniref:Uncharacterized protein n=1 Tax=Brassica carinata TaxID=52824 RepID=A0A8X7W1A8_BRACI|nr:hypothetical protein Bca52824_014577 [Brassica carinata]
MLLDERRRALGINIGIPRPSHMAFLGNPGTGKTMCQGTSMIVHIKMNSQGEDTLFFVFKLHESCTLQAIASVIERETTEKKRKEMNGGLLDTLLVNAREYLDLWLSFECVDTEEICKIRLGDSEAGLRVLSE